MLANGLSDEVPLHLQLQTKATTIELQGNVSLLGLHSWNLCTAYTEKYVVEVHP